jgi:hypothetical protein
MSDTVADQPLARAVLRHLAATRGPDDSVGSLARVVLSGKASLREVAADPWHAQGLADAFQIAQDEQNRMTPEQRLAYEQQARRLNARLSGEDDDDRESDR